MTEITTVESLNHYLNSLDPYSKYLIAEQNTYYKKRGAKKQIGLGINMLLYKKSLLIVPIHNAPAYHAGLKAPHYLITLNNKKLLADNFSSFRFITQLASGTLIPLLVSKTDAKTENKTEKYVVKVALFKNPSVESIKEGKHSFIRIHKFTDGETTRQLKKLIFENIKQGKDIIIDLRYCPGGSLFEAIDAISLFLQADLEVSYLARAGNKKLQAFVSLPGKMLNNQNIYIWVSPFTASAAEIFGRILQHYAKNVVIIGTTTKGKCLSQQVFEFKDGSALQLSVFEIFGPDKLPCEGMGLIPDVEIPINEILNSQYYFDKSTDMK